MKASCSSVEILKSNRLISRLQMIIFEIPVCFLFFFSCKRFALFVYKIWGGGVLSTGNMFLFFLGKNLDEINGHVIMYTVYDNILLFETILHAV